MKRELVIIKLGGSVITDKSKGRGAFRKGVVKRLVSEIIGSMEVFNRNDASGEMKGKLMAIASELSGRDVLILNGFINRALIKGISGEFKGTRILL